MCQIQLFNLRPDFFYFVVYGFFQPKMSWVGSKKNKKNTANSFKKLNLEYFMLGREILFIKL